MRLTRRGEALLNALVTLWFLAFLVALTAAWFGLIP